MLELKVASNDVTGGSLSVAWCVDQQTLKVLADNQIEDPQVVIVTAPTENYHVSKEYRKVVSLKDLMTYLEFRSSGPTKIWAFITLYEKKEARNIYLSRLYDGWSTYILSVSGDAWNSNFDYRSETKSWSPSLPAEPISVNAPAGVFAKSPPSWEQTWVNHWFRSKPIDQCDYRRRRLLAYTVQPVAVLLDLVGRFLLLALSSLWLSRGMTFKYLQHPLSYNILDSMDVFKGGTYSMAHLPEDDDSNFPEVTFSYVFRKFWKLPLMPLIAFPLCLLYHFHVILVTIVIIIAVTLFVGVCFLVISGAIMSATESIVKWFTGTKTVSLWYLDREEIETITCSPSVEKRTSFKALPAKHRTINLRFQDLKSRVCRPFSA